MYDPEEVQKKIMENCKQMCPEVRALITICEVEMFDKEAIEQCLRLVKQDKGRIAYYGRP